MFISVVISTRNRLDKLKACIEALSSMDVNINEVIIVDQSDSGSRYRHKDDEHYPFEIRIIYQQGEGTSLGRNTGTKTAKGEVIGFIDDDCIVSSDWAKRINEVMSDKTCQGVFGKVEEGKKQDDNLLCPSVTTVDIIDRIRIDRIMIEKYDWFICSSNMVLRREVALKYPFSVILGPGKPKTGAEDLELCYRLLRNNTFLVYEPKLCVIHNKRVTINKLVELHFRSEVGYTLFHRYYNLWGDQWAGKHLLKHQSRIIKGEVRDILKSVIGLHPRMLITEMVFLACSFKSWLKGNLLAKKYYSYSKASDLSLLKLSQETQTLCPYSLN